MTLNQRTGATGALMDEYERAAGELKATIKSLRIDEYTKIIDPLTPDTDCKSIQNISNHVVRAGYGYANYIRKHFGENYLERSEKYDVETPEKSCTEIDKMLQYTVDTLNNKWNITEEEVIKVNIKTLWGQEYDFEQILEHAIVHILRHRRQIERFIRIMNDVNTLEINK